MNNQTVSAIVQFDFGWEYKVRLELVGDDLICNNPPKALIADIEEINGWGQGDTARIHLPDKFGEAKMQNRDGKAVFSKFRKLSPQWINNDDGVRVQRLFFVDELDKDGVPIRQKDDWRWMGKKERNKKFNSGVKKEKVTD